MKKFPCKKSYIFFEENKNLSMEKMLAEANQVAENADKPDILDDVVSAMLRIVYVCMRVKTSFFPTL